MLSSHICYSQLFILLWNVCSVSEWFFFFFGLCDSTYCKFTQLIFRHSGLPIARKYSVLQSWKPAKQVGQKSDSAQPEKHWLKKLIKMRINQLINLECKALCLHWQLCLFLVVPQSGNPRERWVWRNNRRFSKILNLDCRSNLILFFSFLFFTECLLFLTGISCQIRRIKIT